MFGEVEDGKGRSPFLTPSLCHCLDPCLVLFGHGWILGFPPILGVPLL